MNNEILKHTGLVRKLAHRLFKYNENKLSHKPDIHELENIVNICLWLSIEEKKNNPDLKYSLGTLAWNKAKYMTKYWMKCFYVHNWEVKDYDYYDNSTNRVDTQDLIRKHIQHLSDKQQKVIHMRYFENKSITECAKDMGFHIESIRHIEKSALRKMRKNIQYRCNP
jgi:RNA polymerase sigma factor (sigma-70 family)